MSNVSAKKVFIKIESAEKQQEHIRNQRKTLKILQTAATDKENFAGRQQLDTLSRLKAAAADATVEHSKRKKIETRSIETQTQSPKKEEKEENKSAATVVTAEDLTSDAKPSEGYFERLAEKRREALESTLIENRSLHERIEGLEEELETTRKELDESRSLVELLTEMLKENESEEGNTQRRDINDDDDSDTRSSIEATAAESRESAKDADI